jgi:hypothetical protein
MKHSRKLISGMGMPAIVMALVLLQLILTSGAAIATAPGPESDPNDIYWDDAFALRGVNGTVNAIVRDSAGNVYVGGAFTVAGGVTANNIAKWDGTNWSALGTGVDNTVHALALDSSSNLYVGGVFANAGGVTAGGLAKWNGTAWSDMGTGIPNIYALAVDSSNTLYAGGYQTFSRRGVRRRCVPGFQFPDRSAVGAADQADSSVGVGGQAETLDQDVVEIEFQ